MSIWERHRKGFPEAIKTSADERRELAIKRCSEKALDVALVQAAAPIIAAKEMAFPFRGNVLHHTSQTPGGSQGTRAVARASAPVLQFAGSLYLAGSAKP